MPTSCGLLYYFVHLNANFVPIPSTMFSKTDASNNACGQLIAPVTGKNMPTPAGQVQCTNGLRYWYQIMTPPGGVSTIVPNSMIQLTGTPSYATGAPFCRYIEFKIFKNIV